MLVDVAKVVTALGAFPTVPALVVATRVLLVVRRRYAEAFVLVSVSSWSTSAVHVTKEAIDAPAAGGAFVGHDRARLSERPRGLRHGVDRGGGDPHPPAGLVTNGALVFDRPGDRGGGRGLARLPARALVVRRRRRLGARPSAIFALLAVIALVVDYFRHNGRQRERRIPRSGPRRT